MFAVKTCSKYHEDRVSVVQNTWAPRAKNVAFFSDTSGESILCECEDDRPIYGRRFSV